jgi:hypothetical protein
MLCATCQLDGRGGWLYLVEVYQQTQSTVLPPAALGAQQAMPGSKAVLPFLVPVKYIQRTTLYNEVQMMSEAADTMVTVQGRAAYIMLLSTNHYGNVYGMAWSFMT